VSFTATPLSVRIGAWIAGRRGVEHGEVLLDRRRVYILPTRAGLAFGVAMLVLLIGSINYMLQLGYLLTFLVTSIAIIGMYHTHRNLARCTVRGQRADKVFVGDVATFGLALANPTAEARYALHLNLLPEAPSTSLLHALLRPAPDARPDAPPGVWVDIVADGARQVELTLPATRRGRLPCPRVRIETLFPFGLWQAWAYTTPALTAIVYPRPEEDAPPAPLMPGSSSDGTGVATSGDDFAGVRPYQAGDPQKMIAWKLAARSDELSVKLFDAPAGGELVLDFAVLPAQLDLEAKLSRLARWVLEADAAQARFGLALPGQTIAPNRGVAHREQCLTALALFGDGGR
jgi:uncharacterized protein (DUF58 family)